MNEQNIRAFAAGFDPPLKPVPTQRVDGIAHKDAWTCSMHDPATRMGVTAVAYEGQFRAWLEITGRTEHASDAGRQLAAAMGRLAPDV